MIRRHVENGGRAFYVRDEWILEVTTDSVRREEWQVAHIQDIPATHRGTSEFQVSNSLAAAAVCRALDVPREHVALGLKTFQSELHNAGRMNFYRLPKGIVLVDYGHNPAAIAGVGRMLRSWRAVRQTCVLSAPGDRDDHVITLIGEEAARYFQRVILKEDSDLRGRAPQETARILSGGVGKIVDQKIVLEESQAVEWALSTMIEGEIIVIFYEHWDAVQATLQRFGAAPISAAEDLMTPKRETSQTAERRRESRQ